MLVIRGPHAGQRMRPHQYANNWISTRPGPLVLSPPCVQLDDDERELFADRSHNVGFFWDAWQLEEDGTFTAVPDFNPRAPRDRDAATRRVSNP